MDNLIQGLMDPGSLNSDQRLALAIVVFVLIASVYFALRLFKIVRQAGKSNYKPNIGLHKVGKRPRATEEIDPNA